MNSREILLAKRMPRNSNGLIYGLNLGFEYHHLFRHHFLESWNSFLVSWFECRLQNFLKCWLFRCFGLLDSQTACLQVSWFMAIGSYHKVIIENAICCWYSLLWKVGIIVFYFTNQKFSSGYLVDILTYEWKIYIIDRFAWKCVA